MGRTAVKQAVLERFPVAHVKLAPKFKCTLRLGHVANFASPAYNSEAVNFKSG